MAKVSEVGDSKYMKAAEFTSEGTSFVIDYVTDKKVQVGPTTEPKDMAFVMHLVGQERAFVLKPTNAGICMNELGFSDEMGEWGGNEVTLVQARTEFNKKMVPCIRVKYEQESY